MTTHPITEALRESIGWQLSTWAVRDETISAIASALGGPDALEHALAGWKPIETAPKDGTTVMLVTSRGIRLGRFDADSYNRTPRPFWNWSELGKNSFRAAPPSHWRPLPAAPANKEGS